MPLRRVIKYFEITAKRLKKLELGTIPFRLSTLVEPFQQAEVEHRLSKRVLVTCLEYEVPVVISTKSVLIRQSPWRELILKLANKGLILVQVSLSSFIDKVSEILEPRAPSPHDRLKLVEELTESGVPVMIRYQPFIPGVSDNEDSLVELFSELERVGVKHLVVESLRLPSKELNFVRKILKERNMWHEVPLESYGAKNESFFLRPSILWRINAYKVIKRLCDKHGIKFATCKEGLYNLWTAEDCCGLYLLSSERVKYRVTLREFWELTGGLRLLPSYDKVIKKLDLEKYLSSANVSSYPRVIKTGVKSHEKKLFKVISDRSLVKRLIGDTAYDRLIRGEF